MTYSNNESVDLERDMLASPDFCALMQCDDFCTELWGAFANITWQKLFDSRLTVEEQLQQRLSQDGTDRHWHASFRAVGGIIADMRNKLYNSNEDYMDWYCREGAAYGYVSDQVRAALLAIHWIPVEDSYYIEANEK